MTKRLSYPPSEPVYYIVDWWISIKTAIKKFCLWIVLELRVKNSSILTFKVFFYDKDQTNPYDLFFTEEYENGMKYFLNFDFQCILFSENVPNSKTSNGLKIVMDVFIGLA